MLKTVKSVVKSAGKGVKEGIKNDPEVKRVANKYPRTFNFIKKRLTPDEKFGLYLTVGIAVILVFTYLFLSVLVGLFTQDILVMSDFRIINIAISFRAPNLDQFMFFMTVLGDKGVVIPGTVALGVFLYRLRRWRYLVSLLASVVFGEAFIWIVKHTVERPRPPLSVSLLREDGYSFPSGHAFIAMAFYGLVGYFVYRSVFIDKAGMRHQLRKSVPASGAFLRRAYKILVILGFAVLIGLIEYSRIYLGVHWPSDVLAGLAAGAAWIAVFITTLEIRRKFWRGSRVRHISSFVRTPSGGPRTSTVRGGQIATAAPDAIPNNQYGLLRCPSLDPRIMLKYMNPEIAANSKKLGIVLFLAWAVFTVYFWKHETEANPVVHRQEAEQAIEVGRENLPDGLFEEFPRVSETISGKPQEPINIIVIGRDDKRLGSIFEKAGWLECDRLNSKNLWRLVVATIGGDSYPTAPGVPSIWNDRPNEISFEKPSASVKEREHIHFWSTPLLVSGEDKVWFGTAHFDQAIKMKSSIIFPTHTIDPAIDKERDKIKDELLKTGEMDSLTEFQVVEPTMGKNQVGDLFFTDGKAYVFYLRN